MSVSEDLARNRKVFGILTGVSLDQPSSADSTAKAGNRVRPLDDPEWERAESTTLTLPVNENPQSQKFSLRYGSVPVTGMALSFQVPDGMEYPALRGSGANSAANPLESLYHRLETEARMTSQLSGEEEF